MKTRITYRHYRVLDNCDKPTGKPMPNSLVNYHEWGGYVLPNGGKTECHIQTWDNGTMIGEVVGYAYCSMSDVYNKKIGREISLVRATKLLIRQ